MAELLKLRLNVPEVIALQFATGKIVESTIPNAPNQVLFTLCDGRRAFLPLSAADRIREAGIQTMQEFEIVKASANDFRVRPIAAANTVSAVPAAIATASPATGADANYTGNGNVPPPPPVRQAPPAPEPEQTKKLSGAASCMMAAMCAAIEAIIETQAYATRRGIGLTFSEESVRAIGLSIYIDACRNGGGR